jgi:hypothetical protein
MEPNGGVQECAPCVGRVPAYGLCRVSNARYTCQLQGHTPHAADTSFKTREIWCLTGSDSAGSVPQQLYSQCKHLSFAVAVNLQVLITAHTNPAAGNHMP